MSGGRATTRDEVNISIENPDSPLALGLLEHYYSELATRFPEGFDLERTITAPSAELRPPRGAFLVAHVDGRPVGCGAIRKLDDTTGEIKRMWVSPQARGHGLGRRLLGALEATAVELGCATVRLDTSAHLTEAIALYRSAGYEEIPAYNDNGYAAFWFERHLT